MLPTVFGSKNTTPGNAPGLNDGASAMVIMRAKKANALKLPVLGNIVELAGTTDVPHGISWIPAKAIQRVLQKNNLSIDDMDLIEINEAFAAMPWSAPRSWPKTTNRSGSACSGKPTLTAAQWPSAIR